MKKPLQSRAFFARKTNLINPHELPQPTFSVGLELAAHLSESYVHGKQIHSNSNVGSVYTFHFRTWIFWGMIRMITLTDGPGNLQTASN